MSRFSDALRDPHAFCVNWELVPGRGAGEPQQDALVAAARAAAADPRIHGLALTDNPGGSPAIATELMSREVASLGIAPVTHFACRDKNRTEIESLLYGLARSGIEDLLVVSGDYPASDGFGGTARPVFDLDPVQVLQLISSLRAGHEFSFMGKPQRLQPLILCAGVAVSPFKRTEAEQLGQYAKLDKKIAAGADYVVTQVGYDMRKLHELLQWLAQKRYALPVLANIFVLTLPAARAMHAGRIPGCVVTDRLLEQLTRERQAADKGRAARIERAAQMYAIARGLGCAGAHIGGHGLSYAMVDKIITRGEELSGEWESLAAQFEYPQAEGFYLYQPAGRPGYNAPQRAACAPPTGPAVGYRLTVLVHDLAFAPDGPLFGLCRRLAVFLDRHPRFSRWTAWWEDMVKALLFGCERCGDCALYELGYLCPMSQCPKAQRNGPCGGSRDGWCEVYPGEKQCVWVRSYDRRKRSGEPLFFAAIVPPCNWALRHTSSWINYFLGRDHSGIGKE